MKVENKNINNKKNIEHILNATDEKILAKALQQYLNSDKKGNENGNKKK